MVSFLGTFSPHSNPFVLRFFLDVMDDDANPPASRTSTRKKKGVSKYTPNNYVCAQQNEHARL